MAGRRWKLFFPQMRRRHPLSKTVSLRWLQYREYSSFTTSTWLLCHHVPVFTARPSVSHRNAVKHFLLLVSRAHNNCCWFSPLSSHHYHNLATSELISFCKSISCLGKLVLPVQSLSGKLSTQDANMFRFNVGRSSLVFAGLFVVHSQLLFNNADKKKSSYQMFLEEGEGWLPETTCILINKTIKKRWKQVEILGISLSLWSAGCCRRYSLLFRYAHMIVEKPPCCGLHLIIQPLQQWTFSQRTPS